MQLALALALQRQPLPDVDFKLYLTYRCSTLRIMLEVNLA